MARIVVTGATGFIGRHVVAACLDQGDEVLATARNVPARPLPAAARFVACDIHAADAAARLGTPDVLLHLAWPGVRDIGEEFHLEQNLPGALAFLSAMFAQGLQHLVVAGTCFEYGLQRAGAWHEDDLPEPASPYAKAKDLLRLQLAQVVPAGTCLQWARIFYAYGPGQSPGSLLPLLEAAVARGDDRFSMSPGEQERDFVHVEDVASSFAALAHAPDRPGIYNICSGKPTKVIDLVRRRLAELAAEITLDTAAYPYGAGEAMSNWGDNGKMNALLHERENRA